MLLILLACTAPSDTADSNPAALPEPWVDHYQATSVIQAGGFSFDEEYLVRRMVDPPAGRIVEEFIATADGTLTETTLEIDADAATFTLSFSDDSYAGTGTLQGPAWAWTGWESHSVAQDGSTVDSVDTVDEAGAIHAEKVGYNAQGEQEWTLVEDLAPISEDTWTELHGAL